MYEIQNRVFEFGGIKFEIHGIRSLFEFQILENTYKPDGFLLINFETKKMNFKYLKMNFKYMYYITKYRFLYTLACHRKAI